MKHLLFCALALLSVNVASHAALAIIPASKDTTLYESSTGSLANGAGDYFFAGRTLQGSGSVRRALIEFDIQSFLPAGAVVNSVTLTLHMSNSRADETGISLFRLTREWTEGTTAVPGNGGAGASPVLGNDATWLHAASPDMFWSGPGAAGDFIGTASASALVGGPSDFYSWTGMVDDVQTWLGNDGTNHGWIIIGDESQTGTAVRFESRTSPLDDNRPLLTVDYTVVPEPNAAFLLAATGLALSKRHRRRQ
jgi:hypothetical protein